MTALATLIASLEATWPPERRLASPGCRLALAPGGGKRVNVIRADPQAAPIGLDAAIETAERTWAALSDTPPLWATTDDDAALDAALAARGRAVLEPCRLMAGPAAAIAARAPRAAETSVLAVDGPLAALDELFDGLGVGAARRAIMTRAEGPARRLMARVGQRFGAVGFVAVDPPRATAFLHALAVAPELRRCGVGFAMVAAAARVAASAGADRLGVAVLEANTAARALFARAGLADVGGYRYRAVASGDAIS